MRAYGISISEGSARVGFSRLIVCHELQLVGRKLIRPEQAGFSRASRRSPSGTWPEREQNAFQKPAGVFRCGRCPRAGRLSLTQAGASTAAGKAEPRARAFPRGAWERGEQGQARQSLAVVRSQAEPGNERERAYGSSVSATSTSMVARPWARSFTR